MCAQSLMGFLAAGRPNCSKLKKKLVLRTVPIKYGGFCAKSRPCGKSRSLQELSESTKKNGGSHAFFRDN